MTRSATLARAGDVPSAIAGIVEVEFDVAARYTDIGLVISVRAAASGPESIRAEVSYAGSVILECVLSDERRAAHAVLRHLATPPLPEAFRLTHSALEPDAVRARIVVRRRTETEAEQLAARLWPAPAGQPATLAPARDLLELQRALVRRT